MAWKDFANNKHYYTATDFTTGGLRGYYVEFQYDSETSTPERVKYRVICKHDSWGNGYGTDYIFLYSPNRLYCDAEGSTFTQSCLLHDGSNRRIPYQMSGVSSRETSSGKVESTGTIVNEFYLFKNWNDWGFTFPEFWICVQGQEGTLGAFDYTLFDPQSGARKNYVTKVTGNARPSYDGWTPASLSNRKGTLTITDNKHNQITISGTLPEDAIPASFTAANYRFINNVKSAYIDTTLWRDDEEKTDGVVYRRQFGESSDEIKNRAFTYTYNTLANCNYTKVEAYLSIRGRYDDPKTSVAEADIDHYVAPELPQNKPVIEWYADEALTLTTGSISTRGYLKISWDISNGGNSTSPTTDGKFYLLVKNSESNEWRTFGNTVNTSNSSYMYNKTYTPVRYCDVSDPNILLGEYKISIVSPKSLKRTYTIKIDSDNKHCYIVIPVEDLGLATGDSIRVAIEQAHSHPKVSNPNENWSYVRHITSEEDPGMSIVYEVGSPYPIQIKNSMGEWAYGSMYAKEDNRWVSCQHLYVKISGEWKKIDLM